jgi:hypothetical protein
MDGPDLSNIFRPKAEKPTHEPKSCSTQLQCPVARRLPRHGRSDDTADEPGRQVRRWQAAQFTLWCWAPTPSTGRGRRWWTARHHTVASGTDSCVLVQDQPGALGWGRRHARGHGALALPGACWCCLRVPHPCLRTIPKCKSSSTVGRIS